MISRHVGMLGAGAAPQEAWLVRRGIKSLPVRMRQICASSQRIAEYLAADPAVERVHYPGLPEHPGHLLAASRCRAVSGAWCRWSCKAGPTPRAWYASAPGIYPRRYRSAAWNR